ncbi:alpha/beta hydrolase [Actinomycetospora chiangmaiensis]|uniref:alpha/beta hydrolase n=1 Tax=Actinomycetospora chiangmaiensis TaxID=402650 RepID=UPI0003A58EEF|nr:alpha/beta hydrolase [Actinomycetospora chiangmaiensis]
MTSSALLRRGLVPLLVAVVVVLAAGASAVARPTGEAPVGGGRPHPSSGTGPDLRSVFTSTSDGTPLHVSFWFPTGAAPAPVLVWVHGGGWIAGSDVDRPADLRRFSQEGWLVMSVEYELAVPGRPTWDLAGPQVACALGRFAAEAGRLGGDLGRMVLAGASAGGQLAVSVGYRAATGTQDSACGLPVPAPRAVVAEYPALDPVDGYEHGLPHADARAFKRAYTGGSPAEVPERYRAVSGIDALSPVAPPTLVVQGGVDRLVPAAGLDRFVAAARARGVEVDRIVVPGADHAFDAVDGSPGQRVGHRVISDWARPRVACC